MAQKPLQLVAGVPTEVEAKVVSAGAGDAGKVVALDAAGKLDQSVMPAGIGADTAAITASEALAAGDFVNIWDSAGNFRVRKADAATNKPAHGFVRAAVANAAVAQVFFEGSNDQVAGATPGPVWLSDDTPGGFEAAAPAGAGKIVQQLGVAVAAAAINVELGQHYLLA